MSTNLNKAVKKDLHKVHFFVRIELIKSNLMSQLYLGNRLVSDIQTWPNTKDVPNESCFVCPELT